MVAGARARDAAPPLRLSWQRWRWSLSSAEVEAPFLLPPPLRRFRRRRPHRRAGRSASPTSATSPSPLTPGGTQQTPPLPPLRDGANHAFARCVGDDVRVRARFPCRRGVASQLVKEAERVAASWGCRGVALHCLITEPGVQQLYRQLGCAHFAAARCAIQLALQSRDVFSSPVGSCGWRVSPEDVSLIAWRLANTSR